LGLIITALLFTTIHTQYGISLDALSVLVIALGLGLIRKFTNTTTSAICHVTYNLVVGVAGAVDIAGLQIGLAIALEALLIAVAGYAIWSNRKRQTLAANP
jgi:membrane protease YdiL (CAAX protease family)